MMRTISLHDDLLREVRWIWDRDDVPVQVAGSLYAVAPEHREEAARVLADESCWIHADVFPDADRGVSLEQIRRIAADGRAPVEVHLLTHECLAHLEDVLVPGVARVTFPWEGVPDPAAVARRIRAAGIVPWLAVSPGTDWRRCQEALAHVDGVLVMLIPPGTRQRADPEQRRTVRAAREAGMPVGVDGGVGPELLEGLHHDGATHLVMGRSLFQTHTASAAPGSATTNDGSSTSMNQPR